MKDELFDRWLAIFDTTPDARFAGPKADEAKQRARMIASVILRKVSST